MSDAATQVATHLARAAEALEMAHPRDVVSDFMLRCSFTAFSESVDLVPKGALALAVESDTLGPMWAAMTTVLGLPRTGIFSNLQTLPLDSVARDSLLSAARIDWSRIELSIFGSLVERSLNPQERHALGAHYTPRSYVERLVRPTVEEPLRAEWEIVRGLSRLSADGTAAHHTPGESLRWLHGFHAKLCATRVLDPACGTGNFLYVAMDLVQAIEREVVAEIVARGEPPPDARVTPAQFLGIEINARAAAIADLVLQMGYLRSQHRTAA